jgi:transcriptional regulator with XRE-family HTH domain
MNMTKNIVKKLLVINDKKMGARLRNRRKSLGMNQIELAKKLKVSQAEISNIERGSSKPISLEAYTEVLRVKPEFLIGGK